ncbi:nitroreductase family deazaflavin-dependent oxidoreductase [Nocardia takedensis]|uniref:nitroreductase family deazaflavin-dependent oxidoreductase n=1 Tax=Nocardia takedensis TaxID=259390 RepID=UPI0005953E65|nr:nitroreductase family deazaflavin-dependent oxidoreductase [Nocardia takedensis]
MPDPYRLMLDLHQKIYETTDGRLGHRLLFGNPTLLLRTVGRKSGKTRTTALTYARDGEHYLVVASAGGAPKAPDWLANLRARPDSGIQVGTTEFEVHARITLPADPDYARRWKLLDSVNKGRYTLHQNKTERTIPIIELTPSR